MLLLFPFRYVLGIMGLKMQHIQIETECNGQHMMHVYLILSVRTGVYNVVPSKLTKDKTEILESC